MFVMFYSFTNDSGILEIMISRFSFNNVRDCIIYFCFIMKQTCLVNGSMNKNIHKVDKQDMILDDNVFIYAHFNALSP